jgi:large conductance mechanosensitive channel
VTTIRFIANARGNHATTAKDAADATRRPNFSDLSFTINGSHFHYGDFINYLIAFVTIAAAIFFFVVEPVTEYTRRHQSEPDPDAGLRPCTECLSEIPMQARKCAFCTAPQEPLAVPVG